MRMITRRRAVGTLFGGALAWSQTESGARQATGVKAGEIAPDSAVIWARRTARSGRLADGILRRGSGKNATAPAPGEDVNRFEGSCPGGDGYVRLIVEPVTGRGRKNAFDWVEVNPDQDYTHQFRVSGLQAATEYRYAVETREARGKREDAPLTGQFRTAPVAASDAPIYFALTSCQKYSQTDRPDGFHIYESLERLKPDFFVSCGDNVYYDSDDPVVNSAAVARYHWARMYSMATLHSCLRAVPGYWQKDDHDAYSDDCYPGLQTAKMAPFQFPEGQRLFREQIPAPPKDRPMYRRFRWGSQVEIWLPDSRDHRTPNPEPDGPEKSVWGPEQKRWLEETLANSTARWKIVINPNPVIGPDHGRKRDNHANPTFAREGREFRRWLKANVEDSVILMNGDRHWQYHSVDPETGLNEFGCGAASDSHSVMPSGGEDPRYHRFLRAKGGFMTIRVNPSKPDEPLVLQHHDVHGKVVYRRLFGARKA
jgi:alkaline phosphatase D